MFRDQGISEQYVGGQYVGCYADAYPQDGSKGAWMWGVQQWRDLTGAFSPFSGLTNAICINYCSTQGFSYAGTQGA